MSPTSPLTGITSWGFPRVSGDEPDRARAYVLPETFSPRERG